MGESFPDKQELQGRLIEILHRISGADPAAITPEARLMEDVGIDSLGFYEILIEADTSFGIRIRDLSRDLVWTDPPLLIRRIIPPPCV